MLILYVQERYKKKSLRLYNFSSFVSNYIVSVKVNPTILQIKLTFMQIVPPTFKLLYGTKVSDAINEVYWKIRSVK